MRDHLREQLLPAFQEIGEERWSERVRSMRLHEAPPKDGADLLDKYSPLVRKQYKTALRERRVGARARAPSFKAYYAKLWSNFIRKPHVVSGEWFTTATLRDQTDIAMEAAQAAFAEMAARMVHVGEDGNVIAGDDSESFASVRTTETYAARAVERGATRVAPMSSLREIAPEDSASGGVDARVTGACAADEDRIMSDLGKDWDSTEGPETTSRALSRPSSRPPSHADTSPPRSRVTLATKHSEPLQRSRFDKESTRKVESIHAEGCILDLD